MKLKVSIIEDNSRVRSNIIDLITASNLCDLVGSASNGAEAKVLIFQNKTDVYLVDLGLPDMDGLELVALIKTSCPQARSLVLSTFGDAKHVTQSIRAGASGYLLKDAINSGVIDHLVTIHNGESLVTDSLVKLLFKQISGQDEKKENAKNFEKFDFAGREFEVMHLLIKGFSIFRIADELCISSHTVNQHLRAIYQKLDVHSRGMAVNVAIQNGFLDI